MTLKIFIFLYNILEITFVINEWIFTESIHKNMFYSYICINIYFKSHLSMLFFRPTHGCRKRWALKPTQ